MSNHTISYISFNQVHFVFINYFFKITGCFTHTFLIIIQTLDSINTNIKLNVGIVIHWAIGLTSGVFTNGPKDLGSVPGWVIPKTQKKWYLMLPCLILSIIRYISRVKWSNPGNGLAPSPTLWCSSYWKGSLRVNPD